jgi:glucose-1-phosphate thymidylyltransferase
MKALILAGGKGTRLRPLTDTLAKHVLPVANKPIICYVLEQIRAASIKDIGVVVSPETSAEILRVLADGSNWGVSIKYIMQSPALGLAHAVSVSRDFLGNSPFLLFLGDNLIQEGVKGLVEEYHRSLPEAMIVLKEVSDPRAFGVAELDPQGNVVRLVEKPAEPHSNLALVGAYILGPAIHKAIDGIRPSGRGEYEITDAIQALLDAGKTVKSHILQGWWLDTGKKEDLLLANRKALDEYLRSSQRGEVDASSRIAGRVEIGAGARIENSRITGPVSISGGCRISNSTIGPYTCLGVGTVVVNSRLDNSIILENASILDVSSLVDSVVGRNVEILGQEGQQQPACLFLGDFARVEV